MPWLTTTAPNAPSVPWTMSSLIRNFLNSAARWRRCSEPITFPGFAELTQKKLKRGVHRSVQALERDIRSWLADWNEHPRPFIWTKTADEILDKVAAYCRRISDSGH
jgi:hypothetical protein